MSESVGKEYCIHCDENTAELVEEMAEYKGKKYKDVFYRCTKCGEEFETLGQLGENLDRIREVINNV